MCSLGATFRMYGRSCQPGEPPWNGLPVAPLANDAFFSIIGIDAEWIVRLREQALRSSERRVSALQSFADAIRPAEQSLSKLGLELRLVDEKTGLPITPDSFVFLGVLAALQWSLLNLLLAPFRGA